MMIRALWGGTLLAFAAMGNIQTAPLVYAAAAKNLQYTGKLTQLDVKKRLITVVFESPGVAFTVSPDAKISTKDKPSVELSDLKIGEMVEIVAHLDGDGWVADRIDVLSAN